jgi:hypothetical protein
MTKLWLIAPILMLAGCGTPPPPPVAALPAPAPAGIARGIDMPTDSRDVGVELAGGGRPDFVARYYRDPASHWPALSAAEAQAVTKAGIKLVAVWESHSHRASYFTYAAGYYDAQAAYRQAKGIGQPAGSAIYFAVDYNAQLPDIMLRVDPYFRGVYDGLSAAAGHPGEYRIGIYGSGAVCDYLKRMRLAQYAWLSNARAWTGYGGFADWDIRQGERSAYLSFSQDSNEGRGDYGSFRVGGTQFALSGL